MFYQKQVQKLIGTSVFGLGMMIANSQNAIALTVTGSLPRSEEAPPTIIAIPPSLSTVALLFVLSTMPIVAMNTICCLP